MESHLRIVLAWVVHYSTSSLGVTHSNPQKPENKGRRRAYARRPLFSVPFRELRKFYT